MIIASGLDYKQSEMAFKLNHRPVNFLSPHGEAKEDRSLHKFEWQLIINHVLARFKLLGNESQQVIASPYLRSLLLRISPEAIALNSWPRPLKVSHLSIEIRMNDLNHLKIFKYMQPTATALNKMNCPSIDLPDQASVWPKRPRFMSSFPDLSELGRPPGQFREFLLLRIFSSRTIWTTYCLWADLRFPTVLSSS